MPHGYSPYPSINPYYTWMVPCTPSPAACDLSVANLTVTNSNTVKGTTTLNGGLTVNRLFSLNPVQSVTVNGTTINSTTPLSIIINTTTTTTTTTTPSFPLAITTSVGRLKFILNLSAITVDIVINPTSTVALPSYRCMKLIWVSGNWIKIT
jgi:hypothetical protein